jgi:type I restriction enzyme S subunit
LDRAIRSKKKVITLLNEQKQAIVHGRVYRGLDSSAALKPSGIPWLGDIPQHWETPLFGRLLRGIEQGWSPIGAEGEITEKQWAVLTLSSVRRGSFNPLAIKPVSLKAAIPSGIEVHNGDILLTRSNTRDRVGDACVVREVRHRTILCDLIYRLRTREDVIDSNFLVYELLSRIGRDQIEQDARGSSGTMPKISQRHIKSWRIVLPALDEQRKIVQQIETESAHFNTAISRLGREIDLLREYHTRLVTDLVSGKLDVRRAAAALSDGDLEADNVVEENAIETDEDSEEFAEEGLAS